MTKRTVFLLAVISLLLLSLPLPGISCGNGSPTEDEADPAEQGNETVDPSYHDTKKPELSNIEANPIQATNATIVWTTNEPATSRVSYGPSDEYGDVTDLDTSTTTDHSVLLTGLQSGTEYHYQVESSDSAGNKVLSEDHYFVTPLLISHVEARDLATHSTTIYWKTGKSATSTVQYGRAIPGSAVKEGAKANPHLVPLTDLDANTKYFYRVGSGTGTGDLTWSPYYDFTTPSAATFEVLSVTPAASEYDFWANTTVTAEIKNTGGETADYTAVLKINGEERAEEMVAAVKGQETRIVSFEVHGVGTYRDVGEDVAIDVGGTTTKVHVKEVDGVPSYQGGEWWTLHMKANTEVVGLPAGLDGPIFTLLESFIIGYNVEIMELDITINVSNETATIDLETGLPDPDGREVWVLTVQSEEDPSNSMAMNATMYMDTKTMLPAGRVSMSATVRPPWVQSAADMNTDDLITMEASADMGMDFIYGKPNPFIYPYTEIEEMLIQMVMKIYVESISENFRWMQTWGLIPPTITESPKVKVDSLGVDPDMTEVTATGFDQDACMKVHIDRIMGDGTAETMGDAWISQEVGHMMVKMEGEYEVKLLGLNMIFDASLVDWHGADAGG